MGGNFGPVLRQAGYDGIELAGAAAVPRTLPRPADAASLTELLEAAW